MKHHPKGSDQPGELMRIQFVGVEWATPPEFLPHNIEEKRTAAMQARSSIALSEGYFEK